ncbi:MAG TPA: phenylalanine--tRNA ligase subunit beta [Candidatus Paceibacterota bacterium]|jgi:phenylalanyl-tRNA synthetase beta chain
MKVSRTWLQKYFDTELPPVAELADAFTFHSFEVEETEGEMLDVNVLPDRAGYALSHRGVATELAAALNVPLKDDPLSTAAPAFPATSEVTLTACDETLVPRYMAALIKGVKVGPSPAWLREALESVGQRSINNVVDATNYVMLDLGQPLHAFDAKAFVPKEGKCLVTVRKAYEGEAYTALTGEAYVLPEDTLVVVDGNTDAPLGIAGVKGSKAAEVNEATTDLILEAANFDGTAIRRASQALRLWTDASLRFQNRPSPELVGYGMQAALNLIQDVAGGEFVGVTEAGTAGAAGGLVTVTLERINGVLGSTYTIGDVEEALTRLNLDSTKEGETFHIRTPFTRRDLTLPEDLAEEVGRVLGYDRLPALDLPPVTAAPDQRRYRSIERIKDVLLERGYVEISTQSFAASGEVELANPLQSDRPWLRASLAENMHDALERAKREAPRVLGPEPSLKLFELGTVFAKEGEHLALVLGYEALTGKPSKAMLDDDLQAVIEALPGAGMATPAHDGRIAEVSLGNVDLEGAGSDYLPKQVILGPYQPFSLYPFALRDIAVWVPTDTVETEVALLVHKEAGELLARMDRFDRFEKDGRVSYAFRLVFQSSERTLSDADLDPVMARMTEVLNATEGWEVR